MDRREKIASSFVEIQLTTPSSIGASKPSSRHDSRDSRRRALLTSPANGARSRQPTNLTTLGVHRERSSLTVENISLSRRKSSNPDPDLMPRMPAFSKKSAEPKRRMGVVQAPSQSQLFPESSDEYDTDLEDDFSKRMIGPPPLQSNVTSQIEFYKALCSRIGVAPITAYEKSLDQQSCTLNYCNINDPDSKALSLPLQVNNIVTRLDLSDNMITPTGATWIAQILTLNTAITQLILTDNRQAFNRGDSLKQLCSALVANRTVDTLDLSGNKIGDNLASHFSHLLKNTKTLKYFNLSHNELSSEGGRHIGCGLAQNITLQSLDLSWNHLRLAGTASISSSVAENVTLKTLRLAMNGFGVAGATKLAVALRENSSLLELDISNNRICMDGAAAFGKIFSTNDTLQVLKMGENPMQTQGSFALIKFIHQSKNSSLLLLDLSRVVVLDSFMDVVIQIKSDVNPAFKVKVGSVVSTASVKIESGKNKEIVDVNPLMIVVTYMESQRMRIVDLFKSWDADNSMSLTREEFREGLKSVKTPLTENQLDELISMLDADGNGEIELNELIQAIEKDYKGIRRKAAQAAKAEGPFPTAPKKQTNKKSNPANIFEQMEDMLDARPTSRNFTKGYDNEMLIGGDNSNYTVRQQSAQNSLGELRD